MLKLIGIALGAGVTSALLFTVTATASSAGLLLAYLAPLPLMIAGLGFSHLAGALAALIGGGTVGLALGPVPGVVFPGPPRAAGVVPRPPLHAGPQRRRPRDGMVSGGATAAAHRGTGGASRASRLRPRGLAFRRLPARPDGIGGPPLGPVRARYAAQAISASSISWKWRRSPWRARPSSCCRSICGWPVAWC